MKHLLFVLLCTVLFACADGGIRLAQAADGEIISFDYNLAGMKRGSSPKFHLERKDGKVFFRAESFVPETLKEIEVQAFADDAVLEEISEIVEKYGIRRWNGFDKPRRKVTDGDGFWLFIRYADGGEVTASGYMAFPKGYDEASAALLGCLNGLVEKYR